MIDLKKIKEDVLAYCERVKANGGKVAKYKCPECKKTLMSNIPKEEGEVWDSLAICYECGKRHTVVKEVSGVSAGKVDQ